MIDFQGKGFSQFDFLVFQYNSIYLVLLNLG